MPYRIAKIQRHNVPEDWRRFGTVTVNHVITIRQLGKNIR